MNAFSSRLTSTTLPKPAPCDVRINCVIWMALWAVRLAGIGTDDRAPAPLILLASYGLKMIRVHTAAMQAFLRISAAAVGCMASVIQLVPFRNRANRLHIEPAMSIDQSRVVNRKLRVATRQLASPSPAMRIDVAEHLHEEALLGCQKPLVVGGTHVLSVTQSIHTGGLAIG